MTIFFKIFRNFLLFVTFKLNKITVIFMYVYYIILFCKLFTIGADSHIHTNDRQRNFIISLTVSTYYFCIVQSVIFLQIIHSYHNPYRIYNIEGYHA